MLLRDYLRAHPEDAERYGRAKERMLGEGISMLCAYSEGKRVIIEDLLTRARAWRPQGRVLRGKGT